MFRALWALDPANPLPPCQRGGGGGDKLPNAKVNQ